MSEMLTMIPLSKLRRSKENTRKTEPSAEVAELAASIDAHGLLQNLTVRPAPSKDGRTDGDYEVVAGARRLEALKLLAKRRRIPKDCNVPCAVLEEERAHVASEISLAENVMRVPLHPADQFEAFSTLHVQGLGAEDIAARFGVTATVVLQRLKLAAVSPKLMAVYREGGMTLDQLTAFTISDDHEVQERVWFEGVHDRTPQAIRRSLTKTLVEGSDRRARLIGAEAYERAGGRIIRDLFKDADEGYFEDSQLLERLVAEKLAAEAEKVRGEGWAWVETLPEMDYFYLAQFRSLPPTEAPLTKREQARFNALSKRHDELVAGLEDEPDPATLAELDRISAEIDVLAQKRLQWSDADKAHAGAILSLDYHGALQVTRGLVKPKPRKASKAARAEAAESGQAEEVQEEPAEEAGYSEALLQELTAHRTAALREVLACRPDIALAALLHALVLKTFFGTESETCVRVRPELLDLAPFAEGIRESKAMVALAERHQAWGQQLPEEQELWPWLEQQSQDTKFALLAYCTAATVHGVRLRHFGAQRERLDRADALARAVGLDMSHWWQPTRATYLDRVTKQQILDAVSEAVSPEAAETIATMKKPAMAARAEELLANTGWLPEPLRSAAKAESTAQEAQAAQ